MCTIVVSINVVHFLGGRFDIFCELCAQWSRRLCSFAWRCVSLVLPTPSAAWGRCCRWCGRPMPPLKTPWFKPTDGCIWTLRETQSGDWDSQLSNTPSPSDLLPPASAFICWIGFGLDGLRVNLKPDWQLFYTLSSFIRTKAQTLVDSLSELMVDASLGTVQCLEEIVSDSLFLLHHCLLILDYSKQMHEPMYIWV